MKLPTILFLIFMTLKLMNYIDWSWWYVSAPLTLGLLWILGKVALCVIASVDVVQLEQNSKKMFGNK